MNKNIESIKLSIKKFYNDSKKEKANIADSIEMFWINADIQRRKTEVITPESAKDNITRIRQLLAAAWAEDYNE